MSMPRRQSGAVLIVALILLTVLGLLGASALQSAALEDLMVAGQQGQAQSLAAAESALREAERWLGSPELTAPPEPGALCRTAATPCHAWVWPSATEAAGQRPLWGSEGTGPTRYRDLDAGWWEQRAVSAAKPAAAAPAPRYVIEELGVQGITGSLVVDPVSPRQHLYRITARGTARGEAAVALVQVVYGRIF